MNESTHLPTKAMWNPTTVSLLFIALLVVFAVEIYYLDLYFEEPRRIIPAMAMLQGHGWLVPSIFGEPYIRKPPAFNWFLAAISLPFSTVNRITARFGIVGIWFVLGMTVYLFSKTVFQNRMSRAISALSVVFCVVILIEKSTLAEPDLFFTLVIFLALISWFSLTAGGRYLLGSILSHALVAVGMLTKGPVVLLFFYIPLGMVLVFHRNFRRWKELFFGIVFMLITSIAWLYAALNLVSFDVLYQSFSNQIAGSGGGFRFLEYVLERLIYPIEVIFILFPFSLLLFYGMNRRFLRVIKREIRKSPAISLIIGGILPLVLLWFYPRNSARYLLPAFPWVGLLMGRVVKDLLDRDQLREALNRILKIAVSIFLIAGLVFYLDYDGATTRVTPLLWICLTVFSGLLVIWCIYAVGRNSVPSKIVFLLGLMIVLKASWVIVYLPLEKPERFVMDRAVRKTLQVLPVSEGGTGRTVYFMDVDPLEVPYYFHKHGVTVRKKARDVRYGLKTFEESLEEVPRGKHNYLLTRKEGIGRGWQNIYTMDLLERKLRLYTRSPYGSSDR